jgi:hypothetical protein
MIYGIIDNFLPFVMQEEIKKKLLSGIEDFDWQFVPDVT